MKTLKRIIPCFLLLMVLFLTGCTNQSYTLVVNKDDSANLSVEFQIDKDTYDLLSVYDVETSYKFEQNEKSANPIEQCDVLFQEAAAVFYDYGFKIEPINDSINIGFEASKKYPTIEELNKELPKLKEDGLIGFTGEVSKSSSIFGETYLFSGTLDYFIDTDAEASEKEKKQLLDLYDASSLNARVFLRMPGDISRTDGTLEDSFMTYKTTYESGKQVPVHLETKIQNTVVTYAVLIIVFIAAVIGAIFLSRYMRKKKEEKKMRELYGAEDEYDEEY